MAGRPTTLVIASQLEGGWITVGKMREVGADAVVAENARIVVHGQADVGNEIVGSEDLVHAVPDPLVGLGLPVRGPDQGPFHAYLLELLSALFVEVVGVIVDAKGQGALSGDWVELQWVTSEVGMSVKVVVSPSREADSSKRSKGKASSVDSE